MDERDAASSRQTSRRRRSQEGGRGWKRVVSYGGAAVGILALGVIALELFGGEAVTDAEIAPLEDAAGDASDFALPPTNITGRYVYVAPDGGPDADGSDGQPLDLATALSADGPVAAGDVVWLRGGVYRGSFVSSLFGTEAAPVVVGAYPGERVTLDASGPESMGEPTLTVDGAYTWFWGLEITSSDVVRTGSGADGFEREAGVVARGQQLKFINMVVHDVGTGFEVGIESVGTELYGNLVYYNGWGEPEGSRGFGVSTRNETETRHIRENIIFSQLGRGIQAFGGQLININLTGNVLFDNGAVGGRVQENLLLGGGVVAQQPVLRENMTYYSDGAGAGTTGVNLGYQAGCRGGRVVGNYLTGGVPLTLRECQPLEFAGNTLFGRVDSSIMSRYPDNTYMDANPQQPTRATGTVVFVRPNEYDRNRAHVIVFNWDMRPDVEVDLSGVGFQAGDRYELRDALDYFGEPVLYGSLSQSTLRVPMNELSTAAPVGAVPSPPVHPAPEFGAFVVVRDPATDSDDVVAVATPVFEPATGVFANAVEVTMSSSTPGAVVRYTLDGSRPTLDSPVYEGPVTLRATTQLAAQASRAGLLMSGVQTATIHVEPNDTLSPTAQLTAPRRDELVMGTVELTADVDDDMELVEVYFLIDGRRFGPSISGQGPYEVEWDTVDVANGTHVIAVVAEDATGNRTTSAAVPVTVQNATSTEPGREP